MELCLTLPVRTTLSDLLRGASLSSADCKTLGTAGSEDTHSFTAPVPGAGAATSGDTTPSRLCVCL